MDNCDRNGRNLVIGEKLLYPVNQFRNAWADRLGVERDQFHSATTSPRKYARPLERAVGSVALVEAIGELPRLAKRDGLVEVL